MAAICLLLVILMGVVDVSAAGADPAPRAKLLSELRELFPDRAPELRAAGQPREPRYQSLVDEPSQHTRNSVERALKLSSSGNWREALDIWQRLIQLMELRPAGDSGGDDDASEDKDWPVANDVYIPVSEYARIRLALMPPEAREIYRSVYDPVAAELLGRAVSRRDEGELGRVADFPASSYADDALAMLGDIHLERGEFSEARSLFLRLLLRCPDTNLSQAPILRKTAICSIALGRREEAGRVLELIRKFFGPELAGPIEQKPIRKPQDPDDWPVFGGDNSHTRPIEPIIQPGGIRWHHKLDAGSPNLQVRTVVILAGGRLGRMPARAMPALPEVNPVCVDGVVYYRTAADVFAVSLATGQTLWSCSVAGAAPNGRGRGRSARGFFLTCADGRLFATFNQRIPVTSGSSRRLTEKVKLVALQAVPNQTEPKVLWEAGAAGRKEPFLDTVTFSSPPIVVDGKVCISARKLSGGEEYLCGLDAATGKLLWKRFICWISARPYTYANIGEMPAAADGVVYCVTGLGVAAAVEAETGRLLWKHVYAGPEDAVYRYSTTRRSANPLIVSDGVLYFLASNRPAVHALDTSTGRELWQQSAAGMIHMIAVRNGNVWLTGDRAMCIGPDVIEHDHVKWQSQRFAGPPCGRGIITGRHLLVPAPKGVEAIDLASGALLGLRRPYIDWSAAVGSNAEAMARAPGNLVMAAGKLLAASRTQLTVFDRRVGLAEIQRLLKEQPEDPRNHILLGQHLQWELSYEPAAQALEKALSLAKGSGSKAAALRDEILAPLFATYLDMAGERRRAGSLADARKWLQHALERAPHDAARLKALFELAETNTRMKLYTEAVDNYQHILVNLPDEDYEPDASLVVKAGLYARARLQDVMRLSNQDVYARYDAEAAKMLERADVGQAFSLPMQSISSLERLLHYRAGLIVDMLAKYPASRHVPAALLQLGRIAEIKKHDAEASAWYNRVMDYHPNAPEAEEAKKLQIACLERRGLRDSARALRDGTATARQHILLPLADRWHVDHGPMSAGIRVHGAGRGGSRTAPASVLHVLGRDLECRDLRDGKLRWTNVVAWVGIYLGTDDPANPGSLIARIEPGAPSEKAGLKAGDLIKRFDGKELKTSSDLVQICSNMAPGTEVPLAIQRDGKMMAVNVELGARPNIHRRPYDATRMLVFGRHRGKLLVSREGVASWLEPATGKFSRKVAVAKRDLMSRFNLSSTLSDDGGMLRADEDRLLVFGNNNVLRVVPGRVINRRQNGSVSLWRLSDGKRLWKTELEGQIINPPVVAANRVAIITHTFPAVRMHIFNLSDAGLVHSLQLKTTRYRNVHAELIGDSHVAVGTDGALTVYDVRTGRQRWSQQVGRRSIECIKYSPPANGTPAAIVASHDAVHLVAIDAVTGRRLWSRARNDRSQLMEMEVSDGVAYVASSAGPNPSMLVDAIDITSGQSLWTVSRPGRSYMQPMMLPTDRYLIVARSMRPAGLRADFSELLIIDRAAGRIAQVIALKNRRILHMAIIGSTLCVATTDALYCFSGPEPGARLFEK